MSGTGKKRKRESGNPGGNDFYDEVKEFNKTIGDLFLSPSDERDDKMCRVDIIGDYLCRKFAWAVPDARACSLFFTDSRVGLWQCLLV